MAATAAPLARRAAARAIDAATVLFTLWALVVLRVFWWMDGLSDRVHPEPWGRAFGATLTFVVLSGVYEVVFLVASKGQTPGKDLMKLRVVPRHGGEAVSWRRALGRWVLPGLVLLVPPLWAGAGLAAATGATVLGRSRRSLADRLAATAVVPYDRDVEDPDSVRPRRPRRTSWWAGGLVVDRERSR